MDTVHLQTLPLGLDRRNIIIGRNFFGRKLFMFYFQIMFSNFYFQNSIFMIIHKESGQILLICWICNSKLVWFVDFSFLSSILPGDKVTVFPALPQEPHYTDTWRSPGASGLNNLYTRETQDNHFNLKVILKLYSIISPIKFWKSWLLPIVAAICLDPWKWNKSNCQTGAASPDTRQ